MKARRLTNLSVEQMQPVLEGLSGSRLPVCALINELGAIALNGSEGSDQAEVILVSELNQEIKRKWTAIRYLCILEKIGKASLKTLEAIRCFKLNPVNEDIVPTDEEVDKGISEMG